MSLKVEITNHHLDAVADIVANKLLGGETAGYSITAVTGLVNKDKGADIMSMALQKCGTQQVVAGVIANHLMNKTGSINIVTPIKKEEK